jgi:hypothetical protein
MKEKRKQQIIEKLKQGEYVTTRISNFQADIAIGRDVNRTGIDYNNNVVISFVKGGTAVSGMDWNSYPITHAGQAFRTALELADELFHRLENYELVTKNLKLETCGTDE